ncbi:receptor-like protein kinase FERONIA, partial [Rhodamnia argentea]|uniref:Receptor-like protein kinase FERONIA n=1 Tax=Rhodamnia argentea TaxID=178133 RepID=A0ABM3HUH9_9MYRT
MKNMKPPLLLFISISVSLAALAVSVTGDNVGAYRPTDDIAVDCGFSGISTADDNRTWIGDADGSSNYSPIEKTRSSVNASANSPSPAVRSSVPYYTARLSRSEFAYTFHVTAGPKFVRLHFFPSDYLDFRRADSFFSVKAAGYTLLHNFRAHLFADNTSSASFSKEFCLTVGDDQMLNITFTPTPGDSDNYAFVNGIEVVSMPESLYYNTVIDLEEGIKLAGQEALYTFGATDALEAVKRLNVGGQFIGPAGDTGLYRTWDADDVYVTSSSIGIFPVNTTIQLSYSDQVPNYTAPDSVYTTARTMGMSLSYDLTWSVEVDAKFYYLVRLHLCKFQTEVVNMTPDWPFEIFINSQRVENGADVIGWSGKGMPVYRDYAVYMDGGHNKTTNLSVALGALPERYTLYFDAILNGLEIFKINNPGGNLAGLNPDLVPDNQPVLPPASKVSSSNHGKTAKIAIIAGVASGFAVLSLLAFFLYQGRNGARDSASSDGTSWWAPVSYATTKMVDPHLKGAIAPECLNKFCEIAVSCLQDEGTKRPSMNDVMWGLEFALQLQVSSEKELITDDVGASVHNGDDSDDEEALIGRHRMDRNDELFSASHSGSGKSRGGAAVTTTSSDDVYDESTTSHDLDKLLSGTVFSEIMNPKA